MPVTQLHSEGLRHTSLHLHREHVSCLALLANSNCVSYIPRGLHLRGGHRRIPEVGLSPEDIIRMRNKTTLALAVLVKQ